MKIVSALLYLLVSTPLWFWLLYQILARVNASELMWFLYWVYVPVSFFAYFLVKIAEDKA